MRSIGQAILFSLAAAATAAPASAQDKNVLIAKDAIQPAVVTDTVLYDTDDPAIWIHPKRPGKSLVLGTDKEHDGGLYAFDLRGKVVKKVAALARPNNVDVAYGLPLKGRKTDIAVVTERESGKIRIFSVPDLQSVDGGGILVFDGDAEHWPMGVALYTRPSDGAIFAFVSRKAGPADGYLWQYRLTDDGDGNVKALPVRKFGRYSEKKEIESIAVDNELGYVYYSDEQYGVHKYHADPDSGNAELALFGEADFKADIEGISIYKHKDGTGYLLVSNQQDNSFVVYPREGTDGNSNLHRRITTIPASTIESDGSDVTGVPLNSKFPQGVFVAMSNGRVFHYYDWRDIQKRIDAAIEQHRAEGLSGAALGR